MKLIKFEAPWCGPCKQQKPMLESLKKLYPDLTIETVNIATVEGSKMAMERCVKTLPTYIAEIGDGFTSIKVGPQTLATMKEWLNE